MVYAAALGRARQPIEQVVGDRLAAGGQPGQ
jgi:hypothetical protein